MASYPDLKSYLYAKHKELLEDAVQKYIDKHLDGNGFHNLNVLSLTAYELDNFEIKSVRCKDELGDLINMDVIISADVVELGLGTKKYEADRKNRWFIVTVRGDLSSKFSALCVMNTTEYFDKKFVKDSALDQFLVPYIYSADLEENADTFILFYIEDAIYDGYMLSVYDILRAFNLDFYYADLPDNCFGRMYFKPARADVYINYPCIGETKLENHDIRPGTILISRKKYFLGNVGTQRLTIAHELMHWYLHRKYFMLLSLLDEEAENMSCEVEPCDYSETLTAAQKAHWFAEWQANALAFRVAMPDALFVKAMHEAKAASSSYYFTGFHVEDILHRISVLFDVPEYVVKQRARQLDWDLADGAFVFVDGEHYFPFSFTEGILDYHQTFVIHKASHDMLCESSSEYSELIESGKYVYLGYVTCINDPKYIVVEQHSKAPRLVLSDYAIEHADECCLIFSWKSTSYWKDECEFYGQAYLSKEVTAEPYVEYTYDKDFNSKSKQSASEIREAVAAYQVALKKDNEVQIAMMKQGCNDFASTLIFHMDRKHITIDQLVERSELSDTTIKKYRSGDVATPPIENVMAVCIGLNLQKKYCEHLLLTASYSLGSTKRDNAYRFLLDYTDGTLLQWNNILDAFKVSHIPYNRGQKTK